MSIEDDDMLIIGKRGPHLGGLGGVIGVRVMVGRKWADMGAVRDEVDTQLIENGGHGL